MCGLGAWRRALCHHHACEPFPSNTASGVATLAVICAKAVAAQMLARTLPARQPQL
eukprot:COSAG03_NODE_23184_length_282_cov_0.939891_1_plen_55_part_01